MAEKVFFFFKYLDINYLFNPCELEGKFYIFLYAGLSLQALDPAECPRRGACHLQHQVNWDVVTCLLVW